MAKPEVYSWRLSPEMFLARQTRNDDGQDRTEPRHGIGPIAGGGARRSERVRELVRDRLKARLGERRAR